MREDAVSARIRRIRVIRGLFLSTRDRDEAAFGPSQTRRRAVLNKFASAKMVASLNMMVAAGWVSRDGGTSNETSCWNSLA